jgi:hypothetical protein
MRSAPAMTCAVSLAAVRGLLPRIATSGRGVRGDAPRPVFSFGSGRSGAPGYAVARGRFTHLPVLPRAAVSDLRGLA